MKTRAKRRSNRNPKATRSGEATTTKKAGPTPGAKSTTTAAPQPKAAPSRAAAANSAAGQTGKGQVPLPDAVSATRRDHQTGDGIRINYYVEGPEKGRPLLLVHAINAAPSVYEVKPLFEHYRKERRVYALDLPGFGFSDRADRRYSPELYVATITDFVKQVIGQPVDAVALSLGGEFTAAAALRAPELFATLTLISPTGFSARRLPDGQGPVAKWAHKVLSVPLWGPGLFRLLATRPSIRYFMGKSFVGTVPAEYIEYAYAAAHQPGAHHAPLYFLSGQLFTTAAVDEIYPRLTLPVLVIHDRDPNVSFERLPALVAQRPSWRVERIVPSLGLPHWERLPETAAVLDSFWAAQGTAAAPEPERAAERAPDPVPAAQDRAS